MKTYKSADVLEMTRISKIQLVHWINKGAIRPYIDDRRRGGVRYFSQNDLFEILICKYLNCHGIPVMVFSSLTDTVSSRVPVAPKYLGGKHFLDLYKKNSGMNEHYAIIARDMYCDNGEKLILADPPRHLSPKEGKKWLEIPRLIRFGSSDEIISLLSQHPTAVVINLTGIAREVMSL